MPAAWKFVTSKDSRNRVTLKTQNGMQLASHYEAEVFDSGEILLHPRVLAAPEEVISQRTMNAIGNAVLNAKEGKTGPAFDAEEFAELFDETDPVE